ncbi:MAG: transcriptional repressor [Candidatus Promineifilaceae bacterium]|nr:transcriptional repressor [Candidatus Promineifilaceae bacterium]
MIDEAKVLSETLALNGYRITAARKAIIETLVKSGGHCTADELVDSVHAQMPGIGRMTVYRTLDILCQLALARPVYQGTGAAHFVLMRAGHHHHMICSDCGQVIEFDDCLLEEISTEKIGDPFGFQVQSHLIELHGQCRDCQGM